MFRRRGLPDGWESIVADHLAVWRALDTAEREQLQQDADWLLRHKHWEAARDFALTDEMRVAIAAHAAVLVLGLDVSYYSEVSAIIVWPTTFGEGGAPLDPISGRNHRTEPGIVPGLYNETPVRVLGQAHTRRGPVMIAWDDVVKGSSHPERGHNVVYHELAHKLDMLNDLVDGTPPLESRTDVDRWVEVCTDAFQALRDGAERPPLQPYGATNPAEFFAVATEAFFDVPIELDEHEPDLYTVLRAFYNQDPAERARRTWA
ncbi:MAG TPA: M90 family metallopeptidase [Acidimicrobiia bacterium]